MIWHHFASSHSLDSHMREGVFVVRTLPGFSMELWVKAFEVPKVFVFQRAWTGSKVCTLILTLLLFTSSSCVSLLSVVVLLQWQPLLAFLTCSSLSHPPPLQLVFIFSSSGWTLRLWLHYWSAGFPRERVFLSNHFLQILFYSHVISHSFTVNGIMIPSIMQRILVLHNPRRAHLCLSS